MNKIIKYFTFACLTSLLVTSCIKDDIRELKDEGKSFLKIQEAPENTIYLSPFTDVKSINILTLRRDAAKNSDLNTAASVKLKSNPAAVEAYNSENHTDFIPLPDDFYTLGEGATRNGNIFTVALQPGEFAKEVKINFNGAKWTDLADKYALAFTVEDPSGLAVSEEKKEVIIFFSIKNQYDGVYRLDGAFYHPTSSPGYDPFTIEVELHTTGPNAVKLFVTEWGEYAGPGLFNGSLNAFGLQEPEITIDPVTYEATVQNVANGAVTFYTMAPNFNSHYDPNEKKLYVKYGYNYSPGPVFDPAANREWTYVFTYLRPRE